MPTVKENSIRNVLMIWSNLFSKKNLHSYQNLQDVSNRIEVKSQSRETNPQIGEFVKFPLPSPSTIAPNTYVAIRSSYFNLGVGTKSFLYTHRNLYKERDTFFILEPLGDSSQS